MQALISDIHQFDQLEKKYIFSILVYNKVQYTKNCNGFFFNIANIDSKLVKKINECVNIIKKNHIKIKEINQARAHNLHDCKQILVQKLKEKKNTEKQYYIDKMTICPHKIILNIDTVIIQPRISVHNNDNNPSKTYTIIMKIINIQCKQRYKVKANKIIYSNDDIVDNIPDDNFDQTENDNDTLDIDIEQEDDKEDFIYSEEEDEEDDEEDDEIEEEDVQDDEIEEEDEEDISFDKINKDDKKLYHSMQYYRQLLQDKLAFKISNHDILQVQTYYN